MSLCALPRLRSQLSSQTWPWFTLSALSVPLSSGSNSRPRLQLRDAKSPFWLVSSGPPHAPWPSEGSSGDCSRERGWEQIWSAGRAPGTLEEICPRPLFFFLPLSAGGTHRLSRRCSDWREVMAVRQGLLASLGGWQKCNKLTARTFLSNCSHQIGFSLWKIPQAGGTGQRHTSALQCKQLLS